MNAVVSKPFSSQQVADLAELFARTIAPYNYSIVSKAIMGVDVLVEYGNDIRSREKLGKALADLLVTRDAVESAASFFATEFPQQIFLNRSMRVILKGDKFDPKNLQRALNKYEPFLNTDEFLQVVPRVRGTVCAIAVNDELVGTGFLIGPDLVMTNYHVVEGALNETVVGNQVTIEPLQGVSIKCVFDYRAEPPPDMGNGSSAALHSSVVAAKPDWLVRARKYFSGEGTDLAPTNPKDVNGCFDYAVIQLDRPVGARPARVGGGSLRGWLALPPQGTQYNYLNTQRMLLFQHPGGFAQQFDIGSLIRLDDTLSRVWYSISSADGSSGGAAVRSDGVLLAIHNAEVKITNRPMPASPDEGVNQGVRIDSIADDLRGLPGWNTPPPPNQNALGFWSLNDSATEPKPIIGRLQFREHVAKAMTQAGERVLTVIGEYGTFARFSVALLQRTLGRMVPIARFSAKNMAEMAPTQFLSALISQLGIDADPADPVTGVTLPATETAERWRGIYLPQWLLRQLTRHSAAQPGAFPAWVAIDITTPPNEAPMWADGLRELVTALAGVRDAGQHVDIPHLRWLFLSSSPLPLGNVRRLQEDLRTETNYTLEFSNCMNLAWEALRKTPIDPAFLSTIADMRLKANQAKPKEQKVSERKALAEYVAELISNAPKAQP